MGSMVHYQIGINEIILMDLITERVYREIKVINQLAFKNRVM